MRGAGALSLTKRKRPGGSPGKPTRPPLAGTNPSQKFRHRMSRDLWIAEVVVESSDDPKNETIGKDG